MSRNLTPAEATDVAIDGLKEVLTTEPATRLRSIRPCDARAVTGLFARRAMASSGTGHWARGLFRGKLHA